MPTTELRPLGFGELLDRTFSYYRSHFWVFVGIMAVPQVLLLALTFALGVISEGRSTPGGTVLLVLAVVALVPVLVLGYTAAYGATTFAVSEIHMGRTITIRGAYGAVRGQMWRLIKLELAVLVRMLAWMITVVLSPIAILLAFWYAFAVPALLLENLGASQSLKRSRFLTRGQLDRIFFIVLLMGIVSWVVTLVIQAPFAVAAVAMASQNHPAPEWLNAFSSIAGGVAGAFTAPLLTIALVLLYYDVRVRKEALDLQKMMEGLDQGRSVRESRREESRPA